MTTEFGRGGLVALMLLAGVMTGPPAVLALDIYVAQNGRDSWSGGRADPSSEGDDGPFATLQRARDQIRVLKKRSRPAEGPVTVHVRQGVYYLDQTFQLDAQDSGSASSPVIYRGYANERPVLVGGKPVAGFAPYKDHILVADLASQGLKGAAFRQLFLDGQRQILARYPNQDPQNPYAGGWAYVDGQPLEMYLDRPDDSRRVLTYKAEDAAAMKSWAGAEICIFPRFNWWNNIIQIASADPAKRTVTLAGDCSFAIRPGDRYYVSGLLEQLNAPGEWYLDRSAAKLYFWPPAPLEHKTVVAPTLRTIINVGKGASWITLRGFDIQSCEGDAVVLTDTTHCAVAACRVSGVGDYNGSGVVISGGSDSGVAGSDISEVGRHGVLLRGGDRATLWPAGNYADNNYIHHVGVFFKEGVGISMDGAGLRASHNLIHDTPRMGIRFSGNNLLVEYNHIRHVNLETEDTGAIYTGGRDWISSRGSVIRYNYFHDSLGLGRKDGKWVSPFFAWGIYLDDNTGGVDVIGNIVARCSQAGIHLHNGRDNLIQNNVFVDNGQCQVQYSGWTSTSRMWQEHLPSMIKGYESIADQPAWQNMRNIKTHPRDAVLPDGLIMSGNTLVQNIFYYRDPGAELYQFTNVPFSANRTDYNLVWHFGLPVGTGQFCSDKALSGNLLKNPGFEQGSAGSIPGGWQWQARPSTQCVAGSVGDIAAEGRQSLRLQAVKVPDAQTNPPWPVIVSDEVPAQTGHAYRLSARIRADKPGTRVELSIQSYVANAYFWNRSAAVLAGPEWKQCELLCRLPAKGQRGYSDLMKAIRARCDLPGGQGTIWIDDVCLVEMESPDDWTSLQKLGFDRHSLIADPLFVAPEQDDWRLKPQSPAFSLGFRPIPIDRIGLYPDATRATWPIVEAKGAREWLADKEAH